MHLHCANIFLKKKTSTTMHGCLFGLGPRKSLLVFACAPGPCFLVTSSPLPVALASKNVFALLGEELYASPLYMFHGLPVSPFPFSSPPLTGATNCCASSISSVASEVSHLCVHQILSYVMWRNLVEEVCLIRSDLSPTSTSYLCAVRHCRRLTLT